MNSSHRKLRPPVRRAIRSVTADGIMDYGLPGKPGYRYAALRLLPRIIQRHHREEYPVENMMIHGLLSGARLRGRRDLPRRMGSLRRLRLPGAGAGFLPGLQHLRLPWNDIPVVAFPRGGAAGLGFGRHRLRRGRRHRRLGRARLPLRRNAPGPPHTPPPLSATRPCST